MPAVCGGGANPGYINHTTPNSRDYPAQIGHLFQDMPCYKFNEAAGVFMFWGRNTELQLLPAEQMQQQLD